MLSSRRSSKRTIELEFTWTHIKSMNYFTRIVFLSVFLFSIGSSHSFARETHTLPINPDLIGSGWKMLRFDGIPPSEFIGTKDGILEIRSHKSSSVLYTAVADDPIEASTLTWSWHVVEGLPATNLKKAGGDDRVLAIHVVFAEDGMMSRFKGMFSPFARGRVLTYVWGGHMTDEFPHPHLPESAWMIIRQPTDAPMNTWIDETVDLQADYQRVFGSKMPPVAYIGVSGDADDLGEMCFGMVRNIALN